MRLLIAFLALSVAALAADTTAIEREMLRLTNAERSKAGLPELKLDERLREAARQHSDVMARHRAIAHGFPGEPDLSKRVGSTGVRFDSVAENVSVTNDEHTAESSHRGLMNSPGHRANILGKNSTAIGIGVVQAGDTYYITEDFAHTYEALTTDSVVASLVRAVAALRDSRGLPRLHAARDKRIARLACESDLKPRDLFSGAGAHGAVVFTLFDPTQLPASLRDLIVSRDFTGVVIEACSVPGAAGGAGQFQAAAAFY